MQPLFGIRDTSTIQGPSLPAVLNDDAFWPFEPKTIEECGIPEMAIESLILQTFLSVGTVTGRGMTERVKLPYRIIDQQLAQLRVRQLIVHARPAPLNDFYYSLTENGQKRALTYQKTSSYTGPAPVPLMDYVLSVEAQASNFEPITKNELKAALSEVTYDASWLDFLGPAINSNSGIFLYGPPGNGKTTLARCLSSCRGQEIWIPHAIIDDGIIIKLYDAAYHIPSQASVTRSALIADQEHDRRWIRVRRPTVVVGGELTLDSLEIRHDPRSNTCEAPLQMKSNCGCLLIDDFGRQRIAPAELLNRWIIPLESRQDFLTLPTGKKVNVPFEQIILFSTNLQPEELVDEAFLRRVPFKINIGDPSIEEFVELFRRSCESSGIPWRPDAIEKLVTKHYRSLNRPLRRCHARDLLHQIKCLSAYRGERPELRNDLLDIACKNYFGNQPIFQSSAASLAPPVGWEVPHAKKSVPGAAPSLDAAPSQTMNLGTSFLGGDSRSAPPNSELRANQPSSRPLSPNATQNPATQRLPSATQNPATQRLPSATQNPATQRLPSVPNPGGQGTLRLNQPAQSPSTATIPPVASPVLIPTNEAAGASTRMPGNTSSSQQ